MAAYTFLINYGVVLILLATHPLITGRDLSSLIRTTERSVRNFISDLESAGYIKKLKAGRQVRYKVNPDLPFRHRTQKDKAIGILLEALGHKPKLKRAKR
jgi:predicted transcriptional regulator of viral defense system